MNSAYLAGVMDSDGSFSICVKHRTRPVPNYSAIAQITWTCSDSSKAFFEDLIKLYGGTYSKGYPSNYSNYPNSRPVYKYSIEGKQIESMIRDILPFLKLKRKQAINILRLRKFIRMRSAGNPRPQRITEFFDKLYILNKALNSKNGTTKCAS